MTPTCPRNFFAISRSCRIGMCMRARNIAHWLGWGAVLFAGTAASLHAQADGTVRWGYSVVGFVDSSPAVGADGTIYVGIRIDTTPTRGRLLALTSAAVKKWEFLAPDWVESSPAIAADGKTIYFGCWDGNLYAVDLNGKKIWAFDTHSTIFSSPTVGPDGTIYIVSGDAILHAVTRDGAERWNHPAGSFFYDTAPAIGPDGTVYFGGADQSFYAVRAADGSDIWRAPTGADILTAPAIGSDGTLYVGAGDKRLLAISPTGTLKWGYLTGDIVQAAPAIGADGTIYFGGVDKQFYAVNPNSTLKWKTDIGAAIASTPAVRADGTIIFGADDKKVHALNPDGSPNWTSTTGDPVESSPVIAADGSIYVGSFDGKLYSLFGTISPLSSFSSWPMLHRDATHAATLPPVPTGAQLINISTYAQAGNGSNLIVGFVVQGTAPKTFLLRGIGPALTQFAVPSALDDPTLVVQAAPSLELVGVNDNWSAGDNFNQVVTASGAAGAFPLLVGSKDAALVASLPPGGYTAAVGTADGGSGTALVEAYDAAVGSASARLINLSTRAQAGTGARILTAGFVIARGDAMRVLVRAVGPGLTQFNVTDVLARPILNVFDSNRIIIRTNTGWTSEGFKGDLAGAARVTGAFALPPGSADSATVLTLASGSYTVQVSGVGGTTGEALVEVYAVP